VITDDEHTHGSYSTISWGASVDKGKLEGVDYSLRATTTPGKVFGFLGALGTVAFAYAGHNVVLEIQATIPSTPEKPSKKPMWRGVVVAYIVVAVCYFPVSLVGYWAFGNKVDSDILITLSRPKWLIALANLMVVIHVIGSYQVHICSIGTRITVSVLCNSVISELNVVDRRGTDLRDAGV
jgi:amino acid permease